MTAETNLGLPWTASKSYEGYWLEEENDGARVPMFNCALITGTDEQAAQRMAYLVKAANSYDPHRALIEELCGVLEVLTRAVGQKETAAALLTHDAAAWMNVADALPGALATLAKARALSPANTGGK